MFQTRILNRLVLVTLLVALVAGCGGSSTTTGSKSPFKVGAVFSLTGAASAINQTYYHDTQMIVADLNSSGGLNGRQIQVTYENDQSDPAQGVTVAKLLINQVGVHVLLGPIFTPPTVAVASLAQSSQVVMFTPGATASQLTSPLQKYIFTAYPTAQVAANVIVNMMQSMGLKKPGVIVESDTYGDSYLSGLKSSLTGTGVNLADQVSIAAGATDATTQVAQLARDGVDVIIGAAADASMTSVYKAAYQQKVNVPILSVSISAATETLLTSSVPIEVYAPSPLACALTGPCVTSFLQEYKQRYPSDSVAPQTVQGYAAISAFFAALKNAKSDSANDVVQALETSPGYQAAVLPAPIQWTSKDHLGEHTLFLEGFKGGKLYFFGNNINQNHIGG
jgi:ABC-type branched-subunit amino acid transport system substrate-binding protein